MKIFSVRRALDQQGEWVTLRRMGGHPRVATEVQCRALVTVGGATVLAGAIQQTGDQILMTTAEIEAAAWPGPPRHGDQVVYGDGLTVVVVQGRAQTTHFDDGTVLTLQALG